MSYLPCAKACWKKLFDSVGVFSTRINAQTRYDFSHCWARNSATVHTRNKPKIQQLGSFFESIGLTIKLFMIVFVSLTSYVVVFVLTILRCLVLPCPLFKKTPIINSQQEVIHNLRDTVNKKLTGFQRAMSLFTTPFKETGFSNSWDEYDFWLKAKGEIQNVAYSWDGFETIDIKLIDVIFFRSEAALKNDDTSGTTVALTDKYIRIEVRPNVLRACNMPQPIVANTMIFKGQLFWDRDGFLEIHPKFLGDLVVVS